MISRTDALALLQKQRMDDSLMRHSLASEAVMHSLAQKMEQNIELWALTGLLHDIDFPQTKESPQQHGLVAMQLLEGHLPDEALHAIKAHNGEHTGCMPETNFDFALRAGETVTGIVAAAALVRPTGFEGMKSSSVKKKMKDKAFAASVNRETIRECEKFGMDIDAFLALSIEAMASME